MVILPVDQGFEHRPARTFAPNPAGYDPGYHFELAIDAGCNAYAAPLGFIEAGAAEFAGRHPADPEAQQLDSLLDGGTTAPAVTGSVGDALRLGCAAIGFTIYPGLVGAARDVRADPRARRGGEGRGPRGGRGRTRAAWISKEGETAIDVGAYAAQIAAQLGAHVIKVKPPTGRRRAGRGEEGLREARHRSSRRWPSGCATCVQAAFAGRRIVIFSGGEAKGEDASSRRSARSATAAASARSSGATPSSARARRRWRCSTGWWSRFARSTIWRWRDGDLGGPGSVMLP